MWNFNLLDQNIIDWEILLVLIPIMGDGMGFSVSARLGFKVSIVRYMVSFRVASTYVCILSKKC